jgi:acetylglutamate kinase
MTRVIKIGGRPQSDPALGAALAESWSRDNGGLVLVHGGGDEVTALQAALGGSTKFVDGRRVTGEKDIEIVRMGLSGSANKRLVASLVQNGMNAVGISGEDATLIAAIPLDADKLGYVGAPSKINVVFLQHLLAGGYLPVISPVSRDGSGTMGSALNVNGDDAAAAIAVAIAATELILVADVEGVLSDGAVIGELSAATARVLVENGTIVGGMQAKLQAGLSAIAGGVSRVRISDIAAITDPRRGTSLRA